MLGIRCAVANLAHQDKGLRTNDLFVMVDKDGSGQITVDELIDIMHDQGLQLNDGQRQELIRRTDTSGDGTVELKELIEARKRFSKILATLNMALRKSKVIGLGGRGQCLPQTQGHPEKSFKRTLWDHVLVSPLPPPDRAQPRPPMGHGASPIYNVTLRNIYRIRFCSCSTSPPRGPVSRTVVPPPAILGGSGADADPQRLRRS